MNAPTETRVIRCENCTRERPVHDVFWHAEDQAWYCQHVFVCEAALMVLSGKDPGAVDARDKSKSGVSLA